MMNLTESVKRVKLFVLSDIRQNRKRYLCSTISLCLGIILALFFVFNGAVDDIVDKGYIDEILRGEGIFYTFLSFLATYLFMLVMATMLSFNEKYALLFYLVICLNARKTFILGIALILKFGLIGIFDFVIFYLIFYLSFLFSLIFYYNVSSGVLHGITHCKLTKIKLFSILKELLFLIIVIILLQLLCHMAVYFVLRLVF